MGTCESFQPPVQTPQGSKFYSACRDGNYSEVETMLPKLTYEELNQIDSDGNSALHIATSFNHLAIVQLLLDKGCSRTILNRRGKTAYQEAYTDEMRALFVRTTSVRFTDENITDSFKLLSIHGNKIENENGIPDDWVKGHMRADEAYESQFMSSIANAPLILRKIVRKQVETESTNALYAIVSQNVKQTDNMFGRVTELFTKFLDKKIVGNLLTLYTAETPIYRVLKNDADSLTTILYLRLSELKARAYQGYAYRGAKMTNNDIDAYQWASKDLEYVLETRTIQSMSRSKSVAKEFITFDKNDPRLPVLLIFHFPEHCETAINLCQISSELPCLSEFEKEEEVTLLPFTLFQVTNIMIDSNNGQYEITLKNVRVPKKSLIQLRKQIHKYTT